jgi:inosine-uridine nucleoside N-ribohydrolase
MLVHLDTDLAGDPDDACALAMLLGWGGVELTGITTTLEDRGRRAGCVRYLLGLAGRIDVSVAAGAGTTLTGGRFEPTWGDPRHWPDPIEPLLGSPGAALDLLAASIGRGATIVAIGGLTNLAMLELAQPGTLAGVDVVAMAGWFGPVPAGLPPWGPDMDFNVQCDTRAVEIVAATASLTLVPLTVGISAWLRGGDLGRLRAAGRIGRLLAEQSATYCDDNGFAELVATSPALPTDLVNFHWDPLTCAVALGWPHARIETKRLTTTVRGAGLTFDEDPRGRPHRIVTHVDAERFSDTFLRAIERVTASADTTPDGPAHHR